MFVYMCRKRLWMHFISFNILPGNGIFPAFKHVNFRLFIFETLLMRSLIKLEYVMNKCFLKRTIFISFERVCYVPLNL